MGVFGEAGVIGFDEMGVLVSYSYCTGCHILVDSNNTNL